MKKNIVKPFIPPADPKPIFGKCRIALRNLVATKVNKDGFVEFSELPFDTKYLLNNPEDSLFYISKGNASANAYYYQTATELGLYIFVAGELPLFTENIKKDFQASNTIYKLTRDKFIYLESAERNTAFRLIDRGTSEATLGKVGVHEVIHLKYPLVLLTKKHFKYNPNVVYFKRDAAELDLICSNSCSFAVDNDVRNMLSNSQVIVNKIAYPIHKPTGFQYSPNATVNLPPAAVFIKDNSSPVLFSGDAFGGLDLTASPGTPQQDGSFIGHDFIRFSYQGRSLRYIFTYHHKKYPYQRVTQQESKEVVSEKSISNEPTAMAKSLNKLPTPVVVNVNTVKPTIQAALRAAFEGGGDPSSIPFP